MDWRPTVSTDDEITLYGVEPGECCLVNVLCLVSGVKSPATAVAEEAESVKP